MNHKTLDYRTPGSVDGTRPRVRSGTGSLIFLVISAVVVAPFFLLQIWGPRESPLIADAWAGYAVATLLSFFGVVAGCIAVVSDRSSGKAWLGLLLNLTLFATLIGLVVNFIGNFRFLPGG